MVGLTAAICLANRFNIAIIDKRQLAGVIDSAPDKIDLQTTALNNSSLNLLEKIGVRQNISRYCPFRQVEVWEEGVKHLKFDASVINQPQLGWIVENKKINQALQDKLKQQQSITPYAKQVQQFNPDTNLITLDDGSNFSAKLVIAADGRDSFIRQSLPIGVHYIKHEHQAVVVQVRTSYPAGDTTWQRFTPDGAQAFLPMADNNASLVWYNPPDYASYLVALGKGGSNAAEDRVKFTKHLRQSYPPLLGEVEPQQWVAFSTQSHNAEKYYYKNVLLLGDAAHSVHPLAGQGANLGFKDVAVLDELFEDESSLQPSTYATYQQRRLPLNTAAMAFMEVLYRSFGNAIPEVQLARQAAMKFASLPLLKQLLVKEATGDSFLENIF